MSPKRSGSEEGSDMPNRHLVERLRFEGWGLVVVVVVVAVAVVVAVVVFLLGV